MARTALFSRKQAGGVFSIVGLDNTPNDVYFVCSVTGSDAAGYGTTPDTPTATLDYAIGLCTAAKGDKVYVLPGHAETISTVALSPTFDKAGITVECLGEGENRPIWTFTHADASFIYSSANVKFIRPLSKTDVDSHVIVHDVNAADVTIVEPELRTGSAKQYLTGIDITGGAANACDRAKVVRPVIIQTAAGGTQGIELGEVADHVVIEDPVILGDWSAAGIHNPVAKVLTNLHLNGGTIQNLNAGSHAVELVSACTGAADNLHMYGDTLGTVLDPGSLKCNGCTETDAIDQAGVPSPVTAAGGLGIGAIGADTFQAGAIDAAAIGVGAIAADAFAAGAIDAAAIGVGAIAADAFAAGAIDAAAIAVGAIAADAFAAGAIDAAAIANGAIDAATFAAGAIDASAIAVGAIAADAFAAGAIDAAAIGVGAIAADAFAAGAIDAAAIANGAIDAATFAAGAIDATAIANGAIDAATFAASAIDATAIAADAITNAKIADNALAAEQFALSAGEKTTDGVVVTRATAALPQSTNAPIFTVTGHVLLKRIIGVVTVAIGGVANATKLTMVTTGAGANTDLCITLDINGAVQDTNYQIDGTFANALIATIDLPKAKSQAVDLVIPPGTINLTCAGSDGGTGRIRWSATYVPLESGAQIVAAA